MKIGIEARFLTHPQHGGFKTYTMALIRSLAETDHSNEYVLYTDRQAETPIELPPNFSLRPVSAPNAVLREQIALPRAMERDGIDLAHFTCNTAPLRIDTPTVVTILDLIPLHTRKRPSSAKHRFLSMYWRSVVPKAGKRSRRVIAVSEYVADDLQATLRLPRDKLRVVKIAIDPVFSGDLQGVRPSEIGASDRFLLAFASMDGRKNHHGVIEAYRMIKPEFPGVKMTLVCAHPDLRSCVQTGDGVAAIGPVDFQELVWLYRNAVGLVFPSFDEGFGLPPIESMASGTPVVISNHGSLAEVAGDCAIYVDPSSPMSIARGIKALMSDDKLSNRLICMGRQRVSGLTYQRMGKDSIAVYTEATQL